MLLVSPNAAKRGIQDLVVCDEWPYYLIFVGLKSHDCVAIGPRIGLMHGDLLTWIRSFVETTTATRLEFEDSDVFDGYIEIDDDHSMNIRTMEGTRLPSEVEIEIRSILKELAESPLDPESR